MFKRETNLFEFLKISSYVICYRRKSQKPDKQMYPWECQAPTNVELSALVQKSSGETEDQD